MKNLIIILFFTFSLSVYSQQTKEENTISLLIEETIQNIEETLLKKDTLTVNNLLHNQLTIGHSNGWIESKESLKNDLIKGFVVYDFFQPLGETEFHYISDSLVITRRNVDVHGTYNGHDFISYLNILEIWTFQNKQWLLTARQSVNRKE